MRYTRSIEPATRWAVVLAWLAMLLAGTALAHCDTIGGPVIVEAKAALEKGEVTPILKWVRQADEAEIKAAFASAVKVRAMGPEARELADRYFLETLVRVHRAGEGAPYTGIKDGPAQPIDLMADKALADGSAEDLVKRLGAHLAAAVQERFARVVETRKAKDTSVEAGREFVAAYVTYMHYVEGVHDAMMAAGGHGHAAPAAEPDHH